VPTISFQLGRVGRAHRFPIKDSVNPCLKNRPPSKQAANINIDISSNGCSNARTMSRKSGKSQGTSHEGQVPKYKNISIIGDGAMATAMALLLCEKRLTAESEQRLSGRKRKLNAIRNTQYAIRVRMWGYDRRQLKQIESAGENTKFLPGYKLPQALVFEPDDERIMAGAELIVSAVPCQFVRQVFKRLKDYVPKDVPIVSTAKGIENDTLLRPTQILADVLAEKRATLVRRSFSEGGSDENRASLVRRSLSEGGSIENRESRIENQASRYAVLSGPTIADELARQLPATACAAAADEQLAKDIQCTFNCSWLRVYTNTDIVGVELAAACKNTIAIAAGIIDGTGAGDNAKAALLCRGLAEITRLGVACGARPQTFAGLTGLGDLVTTCISPKGRNRSFGERIGKGQTVEAAQRATESVIEGIATCKSVIALAERHNVEMPITQAVYEVLFEAKPVRTAIAELMSRRLKAE